MSESTFGQRFGYVSGTPKYNSYPERARIGLMYLLSSLFGRDVLEQAELVNEVCRLTRRQPSSSSPPELSLELLEELEWFQYFELCERIYRFLLSPRYQRVSEDEWRQIESIEEVRAYYSLDLNNLLNEENLAYRFEDGIFRRKGRPKTQENILRATRKVLTDPRLKPVANYFTKALQHRDKFPNPDLENCVKDALVALEACVELLTDKPASKNFNKTLKTLTGNDKDKIPAPISEAMIKLHAYRGSGQGAGHAALSGSRINNDDAELVLSASAAFITYLVDLFPAEEEIPF